MTWFSNYQFKVLNEKLDAISASLTLLAQQGTKMATNLDAMTQEVARNTSVEASVLTLIQGLAAQIAAAGTDPTKLAAIVAQLKNNDDELAAAVLANTPQAASTSPAKPAQPSQPQGAQPATPVGTSTT